MESDLAGEFPLGGIDVERLGPEGRCRLQLLVRESLSHRER